MLSLLIQLPFLELNQLFFRTMHSRGRGVTSDHETSDVETGDVETGDAETSDRGSRENKLSL